MPYNPSTTQIHLTQNQLLQLPPPFPPPLPAPSFRQWRPLLLQPWHDPMRSEGADVAKQRVRRVWPGPAGRGRQH